LNALIRTLLLAIYAFALVSLVWPLPYDAGPMVQRITAIVLAIHVIELAVAFRHVRLYRGGLAASVVLTLLFGLLHWKPLADAHQHRKAV
jgi:uncharacterized protein YhhL (DUF1145 family)